MTRQQTSSTRVSHATLRRALISTTLALSSSVPLAIVACGGRSGDAATPDEGGASNDAVTRAAKADADDTPTATTHDEDSGDASSLSDAADGAPACNGVIPRTNCSYAGPASPSFDLAACGLVPDGTDAGKTASEFCIEQNPKISSPSSSTRAMPAAPGATDAYVCVCGSGIPGGRARHGLDLAQRPVRDPRRVLRRVGGSRVGEHRRLRDPRGGAVGARRPFTPPSCRTKSGDGRTEARVRHGPTRGDARRSSEANAGRARPGALARGDCAGERRRRMCRRDVRRARRAVAGRARARSRDREDDGDRRPRRSATCGPRLARPRVAPPAALAERARASGRGRRPCTASACRERSRERLRRSSDRRSADPARGPRSRCCARRRARPRHGACGLGANRK